MDAGHQQRVAAEDRAVVEERDRDLVLEDDVAGRFAVDEAAEGAVGVALVGGRHGPPSPKSPATALRRSARIDVGGRELHRAHLGAVALAVTARERVVAQQHVHRALAWPASRESRTRVNARFSAAGPGKRALWATIVQADTHIPQPMHSMAASISLPLGRPAGISAYGLGAGGRRQRRADASALPRMAPCPRRGHAAAGSDRAAGR